MHKLRAFYEECCKDPQKNCLKIEDLFIFIGDRQAPYGNKYNTIQYNEDGTFWIVSNKGEIKLLQNEGSPLYYGEGAPDPNLGIIGSFYVDTINGYLYGPKDTLGWTNYFEFGTSDAINISFDNTNTNFLSTNVQNTLEEIDNLMPTALGNNTWYEITDQVGTSATFDITNGNKQRITPVGNHASVTITNSNDGDFGYLMVNTTSSPGYQAVITGVGYDARLSDPAVQNPATFIYRWDNVGGTIYSSLISTLPDRSKVRCMGGIMAGEVPVIKSTPDWSAYVELTASNIETVANRVGINGTPTRGALDIKGGALAWPESSIPYPAINGSVRYDNINHKFMGYVNGVEKEFMPPILDPNTIYVNNNNSNATDTRTGLSNYSIDRPFKTLTAAFAAATNTDSIFITGTFTNQNIAISGSAPPRSITFWDALVTSTTSTTTISIYPSGGGVKYSVFLYNSTISNSGGGRAVQLFTASGNIMVHGIGNSYIMSNGVALEHRRCRVSNLQISTTGTGTTYALTGGVGNEVSYFYNCIINSLGRGADRNAQFENCTMNCTNRCIAGVATGGGLGYLIRNCLLISTSESALQFSYGGSQTEQLIVKNCLIKTNTIPFQIQSGNTGITGLNLNLYDNVIETSAAYVATMPVTTSPAVIIASNNNSNKDIIDPSTSPAVTHILNNNFVNTAIKAI